MLSSKRTSDAVHLAEILRVLRRQMSAADEAVAAGGEDPGNLVETRRVPRSKDHEGFRVMRAHLAPGFQNNRLLARHRARRNQDGRASRCGDGFREDAGKSRRAGRLRIEFQISRQNHALRQRTQLPEAFGIGLRLRADHIHIFEHAAHERAQQAVAPEGARGEARVDKNNPRSGIVRGAQKVWPQLRLYNHQQGRLNSVQRRLHRSPPIQGQVEPAGHRGDSAFSGRASRRSNAAHENLPARKNRLHLARQPLDRQGLAHRNGVNPDCAPLRLLE